MKYMYMALGLSFGLLLYSCQTHTKEEVDFRNMDFMDLFPHFISNDNENLHGIVKDSIVYRNKEVAPRYFTHCLKYYVFEEFDTIQKEVNLKMIMDEDYHDCEDYRHLNLFQIFIDYSDTISVPRFDFVSDTPDSLSFLYQNFYLNVGNKDHLADQREREINLIGVSSVSRGYAWIKSNVVPDSIGNHTSISQLKAVTKNVVDVVYQIRNQASKRLWKKDFEDLGFPYQKAICELHPLHFVFEFNAYYPVPPPPPPFIDDEELKRILDDEDWETDKQ